MKKASKRYEVKDRLWLRYAVMAGVLAVFAVLIAWWQRAFVIKDTKALLGALSTAFFIPGIVTFLTGLSAAIKSGTLFDPLVRLFKKLIELFRQDRVDRKYRNFAKYNKVMRETKPTPWYMVIVGLLFTAVGAVLLCGFMAM